MSGVREVFDYAGCFFKAAERVDKVFRWFWITMEKENEQSRVRLIDSLRHRSRTRSLVCSAIQSWLIFFSSPFSCLFPIPY